MGEITITPVGGATPLTTPSTTTPATAPVGGSSIFVVTVLPKKTPSPSLPDARRFGSTAADYQRDLARFKEHIPTFSPILPGTKCAQITSLFGKRRRRKKERGVGGPRWRRHQGVDFAALRGTPVMAAASGRVAFSGYKRGYGWIVIIDHGFGFQSRYAHLRRRSKCRKGAHIERGDRIGGVGNSGRSTGPHLHFEIRKNGKPIDPMPFVGGEAFITPGRSWRKLFRGKANGRSKKSQRRSPRRSHRPKARTKKATR